MHKRLSAIKKYIDNATTPATSRWGSVNTLLAVSAIFIAIGAWRKMNWMVVLGLSIGGLAIILGIIWLIKGSKDPTATEGDITKLGHKIEKAIKASQKEGTNMLGNKLDEIISLLKCKGENGDKK